VTVARWHTDHTEQHRRITELTGDLLLLASEAAHLDAFLERPWDKLYRWAENALGIEAQECLVSLLMEPYADLVARPRARAWYVSQEKLEPRLGERHDEELDAYEQPLAPGRDAAQLFRTLAAWRFTTTPSMRRCNRSTCCAAS